MVVEIFAPATIGNVGPGFDVLGLAVHGLGDRFWISPTDMEQSTIAVTGRDAALIPTSPEANTVTIAAKYLADRHGEKINFKVQIERQLPASGGLGSSAASSVAGALGAAKIIGLPLQSPDVLAAALHAESQVAGRHLDNIAPCLYGGLCIVQDIEPVTIHKAPCQGNFFFVLLSPDIKIDTKASRSLLPKQLQNKDWIRQMALTASLLTGFAKGDSDTIRLALQDPFAEPRRAALIPNFYQAKKAALDHGALGFSISGGGPSCFAICQDEATAQEVGAAVMQAFDAKTSIHIGPMAKQGATVT